MQEDRFESQIPNWEIAVAALRATDPEFDEIYRDYLLLQQEREAALARPAFGQQALLADLTESVSGLRAEILSALTRFYASRANQGDIKDAVTLDGHGSSHRAADRPSSGPGRADHS